MSLLEIGNEMQALCRAGGGMEREELLRESLGFCGGKRQTPAVRPRVEDALTTALVRGMLREGGNLLTPT